MSEAWRRLPATPRFSHPETNGGAQITTRDGKTQSFNSAYVDSSYSADSWLYWLPTATRPNYSFDGWYFSDNRKCDTNYFVSSNTTINLYAHWTQSGPDAPVWVTANNSRAKRGSTFTFTWKRADLKDTRKTYFAIFDATTGKQLGIMGPTTNASNLTLQWKVPDNFTGGTFYVLSDDGLGLFRVKGRL